MYSAESKSYDNLNQMITERQNFEKNNPIRPYSTYPTTLNYKDIKGYALIHYAAMIGDIEKIKFCIDQKADVNLDFSDFNLPLAESHKSPLQMALENGHLETAKMLYEAGADVESIRLNMCGNEACRVWLKNLITEAFFSAYPDPDKIESGPQQENRFFKTLDSYDKVNSLRQVLVRAIEIENIEFLESIAQDKSNANSSQFFTAPQLLTDILKSDNQGIFYPEKAGLLQMAVANNNEKIAAYLISKGAKINPEKSYRTHPLYFAILNNDETMVDFLLDKGADVHYSDRRKYTPLMYAVMQHNVTLVKKLLERGARVEDLTIDGDNVFHLLASNYNSEIFAILSQTKGAEEAQNKKNIYGFTPNDIQTKLVNGTMPPTINQTKIAHIMHYYLRSQYRDTKYFPNEPHCNGFGFVHLIRSTFESPEYYFATFELFAQWDGSTSIDSLLFKNFEDNLEINDNLKKVYKKYGYKNVADVLEQWMTDIAWFQANSNIPTTNGLQKDRDTQYAKHADLNKQSLKDNKPKFLLFEDHFDSNEQNDTLVYSRNQAEYAEILKYLHRMPSGLRIEFHGGLHLSTAILHADSTIARHDPNHKHQASSVNDPEKIAQDIINYQTIRIKNDLNRTRCHLHTFYTQKDFDNIDCNSSIILTDDEIPTDKKSAELFQENSPNKFTPLHIAIMTNNIALLKKLIASNIYDLNARDKEGRTPIHFARICNSEDAVIELLKHIDKLDTNNLNHVLIESYRQHQTAIFNYLFEKNIRWNFELLLESAILMPDIEFTKKLVEDKNVPLNTVPEGISFPILNAIQTWRHDISIYLLEHGADPFMTNEDNPQSALQQILCNDFLYKSKTFTVMCKQIQSANKINYLDEKGYSAIHYAVKYNNPDALRILLNHGADLYAKDANHQTILDYCSEKENVEIKKVIAEHIEFIGLQSGLRF